MCVYIYIYTYVHIYIYIYICMYIQDVVFEDVAFDNDTCYQT